MTYLSGKSKSNNRYLNIALGFIAFVLFVYYWSTFRAIVYPIVEPVLRGYGSSKGVMRIIPTSLRTYFSSRSTLATENKNLEVSIERLENELAGKDAIIRENLAATNGKIIESQKPVTVLYPIAEDITKMYSTILLSKGYKDGIEKNAIVYVRGMQPVCEIIEVFTTTSLCELLSKGNRKTEGVTSSSTMTLTLTGEGGGSYISSIPKGMNVAVGETVYLRSNPAFILGTVVMVKEDDQATGAKIYVKGAYNPVTSSVFYLGSRYAP